MCGKCVLVCCGIADPLLIQASSDQPPDACIQRRRAAPRKQVGAEDVHDIFVREQGQIVPCVAYNAAWVGSAEHAVEKA